MIRFADSEVNGTYRPASRAALSGNAPESLSLLPRSWEELGETSKGITVGDLVNPLRLRLDTNQMMLVTADFVFSAFQQRWKAEAFGASRQESRESVTTPLPSLLPIDR
jgi:hypothetical protein